MNITIYTNDDIINISNVLKYEIDNNIPQEEKLPEDIETEWIPDIDKEWEWEWPKYGYAPLRRRKIKSNLYKNEMVKVNDI